MCAEASSRREMLASAVAGALGMEVAPFVRSVQAQPAPGPIETAHPTYVRLLDEWDARCVATWDIEDQRHSMPPQPAYRFGVSEGGFKTIPTTPGKCRLVLDDSAENIAWLRVCADEPCPPDVDEWWHATRSRDARECLVALEAWQDECRRLEDAVGLADARAAEARARSAAKECEAVIFGSVAANYRELAFQAFSLREDWRQDLAEKVIGRLVELAGIAEREIRL